MSCQKLKYTISVISILILPVLLFAQADSIDAYDYNLIELSNFTVNSVSKVPQKYNEIPATMRIVTKEEIRENGYFTLEDVLASLPGFQFRNIVGFNSYIFQRGLTSQNNLILVLIDGIQINELNSGGFYAGGQFNLENVERLEVVYGPASVIYGTNAVSGIINIITKTEEGFSTSMLIGNFNTLYSDINYGYQNEDFGLRISGMYKSSNKADLRGEEGDNNWTEDMDNYENDYSFDSKLWYKNLVLGLNFQNKQSSTSTYYPAISSIYQDYGSLWNIFFVNSYLKHECSFSDNLSISSKIYNRNATVSDNTISSIVDTAQIGYYRPNNLTGVESILNYSYKSKIKLVAGIMLETESIADGFSVTYSNSPDQLPPKPEKPDMVNNHLVSLFLESKYKIVEQLILVGGLRFDNSSVYNQVLTPRLSLVYNKDKFNSKLLYAEAYRAPKPWDYTNGLGNSDLLPEHMKSFELSNSVFFSDSYVMSLSLYKNVIDEAIVKEVSGSGDNYRWINQGRFETDGMEIEAHYSAGKLKMFANYTYNFSYDENKEIIPEIAKHTVNTGFTYRFLNNYLINLRANYFGKRRNPQTITATNSNFIEPALIFNGTLSFMNFHKLDMQIVANNILNTKYYHTSNRLVERYRQPQRTIMLKLAYNF
ncbi:MAG: TonB-dependent receptor [Bacteroidetes bacterium]|jgi:outer membrane receptor for ferrienterochelin and colicins|nr:TonB-dependent receptor [Bacteroidota bacterium]MBT7463339.1 TonB-dependent receptor [Bacteroidota bacterium]